MNFLKIGSSPVVEIPLAVEFNGINLNQCYQLLAGPKVITTFDPNWSNVVDVDDIKSRLEEIYSEIADLLILGDNGQLTAKVNELGSLRNEYANSGFSGLYMSQQLVVIDNLIDAMECRVSTNARVSSNSCDVESSLEDAQNLNKGKILFNENHIVEAENIVSRHFTLGNNLRPIYDNINADALQYATSTANTHFKDGTIVDIENFIGICVEIWIDHIAASSISTVAYNNFKAEINGGANLEDKALKILKRGVIAREKLEFFVFATETVLEIITMAAGTYPNLGSQLSYRRSSKGIVKSSLNNSLDNQLKEFYIQKAARSKPGTATGNGTQVNASSWLQGTEKEWGNVPSTIANTLNGKSFKNFDELRVAFWKAVGNDPNLRKSFNPSDWSDMIKYGKAPKVLPTQV